MKRDEYRENYRWDKEFSERYVICGVCALDRNGLVYATGEHLDLFTKYSNLDKLNTLPFAYFYNSNIDYEYRVSPSQSNPMLLLPSKERALVECIKHSDWMDEGFLIEGLKSYLDNFWDGEELYRVAAHFDVSKETLDYCLKEAGEDCEV